MSQAQESHTILWRVAYMLIAIILTVSMFYAPILSFVGDTGVSKIRTCEMDQKSCQLIETQLDINKAEVKEALSTSGLRYVNWAILIGCIATFLCFWSGSQRMMLALYTMIAVGVYYLLLVYYAVEIANTFYATMYPNIGVFIPLFIVQMMILTRRNILNQRIDLDELPDE